MPESSGLLERAFELAKSGQCRSVTHLGRQLEKEGYQNANSALSGKALRAQLRALCIDSQTDDTPPNPPRR